MVNKEGLLKHMDEIRSLIDNKKKIFKLAGWFGWDYVLRFLLAQIGFTRLLSLEAVENRATKKLGLRVQVVYADASIASECR